MPSKSWKNHEKAVAEYFHGTRMSRSNYGIDAPDVLVPMTTAINTIGYKGDCIIECKYSINMKWHRYCFELLDDTNEIVICKNLIAFDMVNTKKLIPIIIANQKFDSVNLDKTIPSYLNNWITQSESYSSYAKSKEWLPLLCLGQKSSRNKLIIVNKNYISKLKCQPIQRKVMDLFSNRNITQT